MKVYEDNKFIDGLFAYMASDEGQLFEQIRSLTWDTLEKAQLDITNRRILWETGERLSIRQCAEKLHALADPSEELPLDRIELEILAWLEMEDCFPPGLTDEQQEEMEEKIRQWISEHRHQMRS